MRKLLVAAALVLCAGPVYAGTITMEWTNATIAAGDITPDGTKAYCTIQGAPYPASPHATVPFTVTKVTVTVPSDTQPINYTCVARHFKGADQSAPSNEIVAVVPAAPIKPPVQLKLSGSVTFNPDGSIDFAAKATPVEPEAEAALGPELVEEVAL